jgi:predicted heme/steroid binding protein
VRESVVARVSLRDFQQALVEFFQCLLAEQKNLTVAVDGKTSKQFHQADGNAVHLLNLFVHDLSVVLAQYSVGEDKTNEADCLKKHANEFFEKYPFVQLLTGDAIFAGRPLLEVLKGLKKDYLFCVKDNQETILESIVQAFAGVDFEDPDFQSREGTFQKNKKKEAA